MKRFIIAALIVTLPMSAFAQSASQSVPLTIGETIVGSGLTCKSTNQPGCEYLKSFVPMFEPFPQDVTMSSLGLSGTRRLTISRSADCKLVILENLPDRVVIGCRAELGK